MATIRDVYQISSRADVGGIEQAANSIYKFSSGINTMAKSAKNASSALERLNNRTKASKAALKEAADDANKVKLSFKTIGLAAKNMAVGIGIGAFGLSKLRSAAGAAMQKNLDKLRAKMDRLRSGAERLKAGIEKLRAVFSFFGGLIGKIGEMRDAIVEEGESLGGMAEQAEVATEATDTMKSSLSDAAETAEEAAAMASGAFGAFGDVGAGFIMAQGKVSEQIAAQAQKAVTAAEAAAEALEDEQQAAAGAARSTNDFVNAVDRIGAAWDKAKKVVRDAIAKAITPALEEFAELLESPVFEEFVELLAEDLADVLENVANYIIKEVIPKLKNFMQEVINAGGPVEYLKGKLNELKTRAKNVVDSITTFFRNGSIGWASFFRGFRDTVMGIWNEIKTAAQTAADGISQAFQTGLAGATSGFNALLQTAIGALNKLISAVEEGINGAIKPINEFINLFNSVSRAIGGKELKIIKEVSLPRIPIPELQEGGVSTGQTLAMIGDNPSGREAVIPLDSPEALATLREALGGGGMQIQNVNITVSDRNMANDFLNGLRARGVAIPL